MENLWTNEKPWKSRTTKKNYDENTKLLIANVKRYKVDNILLTAFTISQIHFVVLAFSTSL